VRQPATRVRTNNSSRKYMSVFASGSAGVLILWKNDATRLRADAAAARPVSTPPCLLEARQAKVRSRPIRGSRCL
jgi:hypothetical protein